ncbi:MAG: hypothetical protein FJ087_22085, partial [Deltaproteobacteria bacterium]|nr:hypothetical protein [Deltaproteobacteria bacterium]
HGHTAAVHDALTRVPGSFDETVAGIRNAVALKAPALDLGVNVTVATQNVGHLPAIADLAYDLGVRKLNLQLVTPFGRAGLRVVPPMAHAVESVREVLDRNAGRMTVHVVNAQPCLFPAGYAGNVAGDYQKVGRTMVFVTEEEVNLFGYLASRRVRRAECIECARSVLCEGFFDFTEEGEPDAPES